MVTIAETDQLKLIGTSDLKKAKFIGQMVGVFTITHGQRATVEEEHTTMGEIIIINCKGEIYEFAKTI